MAKHLIRDIVIAKKQTLHTPGRRSSDEDAWDKAIKNEEEKKGGAAIKEEKVRIRTVETKKKSGSKSLRLKPLHRQPESSRPKPKLKFILGFAGLVILAGASIILLNKFSSVAVEITPRQQNVNIDINLQSSIEPKTGEFPLEVMQLSRQEKGSAPAMGSREISQKASGQIVIYNAYSSQPQSLIKDTRFQTPDGKIYRINKSVVVPGAKIEEGKIIPSGTEVTVFADKPSEEYNIGLTDFTIPGFKGTAKYEKFYGRSKTNMEKGFVGNVSVVIQKDIDDLESSLKEKISSYLLKMATNPKPDEFLLYDGAKQIVFNENKNMPKPGDEAKQIEIEENGILFGFLLKKTDINQKLGEKYFDPGTAKQVEVVNFPELNFELESFSANAIAFSLKGQARFIWKIDESSLKNDLAKKEETPDNIFKKYPAITKASIVFKPSWWPFIPKDPSRITIQKVL